MSRKSGQSWQTIFTRFFSFPRILLYCWSPTVYKTSTLSLKTKIIIKIFCFTLLWNSNIWRLLCYAILLFCFMGGYGGDGGPRTWNGCLFLFRIEAAVNSTLFPVMTSSHVICTKLVGITAPICHFARSWWTLFLELTNHGSFTFLSGRFAGSVYDAIR